MSPRPMLLVAPRLAALALTFSFLSVHQVEPASFPPGLHFRTVTTERVSVHFHQGLEATAREAAALATEILAQHEARYRQKVGRVQIVIVDHADDSNGFATPLPYPLVTIHAAAPNGGDSFGNHEGWLRLVLSHELAHIVHLEEAHGVWRLGRTLMGRAPFLFPNTLAMSWMVEGLATYEETRLTAFGRGRNPDSRMVLRMAALEHCFPKDDQAIYALDAWPGGQTPYVFGEAFLRRMTEISGPDVLPRLGSQHAGQFPPYLDGRTVKKTTGTGLDLRWKQWAGESSLEFEREAAQRSSEGLTNTRVITTRGVQQEEPRFSPDGSWIAYTSRDLTRFPEIRIVRPDGRDDHRVVQRNGGSGLAWTPDGRELVFSELQVHHTFSTFADLAAAEVASGHTRRLTRGMRAFDPDVSPGGKTAVFVRRLGDRSDLFTIGTDGTGLKRLTSSLAGVEWGNPRFSPDGESIAASRVLPGGWLDLVRLDLKTGAVEQLTHDRAKDVEPAWSPDGRTIVFRSDRDGVSNLYAVRLADRTLVRLTNVLGGAFHPSISPDGQTLAFASYSSRGYDIVVAAFAPAATTVAPFLDDYPLASADPVPVAGAATPYRAWSTVLPRYWSPSWESDDHEDRIGLLTGGSDALRRHVWALRGSYGTGSERPNVSGYYVYDRFRTTLLVSGQAKTDMVETRAQPGQTGRLLVPLVTRQLNVQAILPIRSTIRSSQALSLGYRREREYPLVPGGSSSSSRKLGDPLRPSAQPEDTTNLGGIEAAWTLASAKRYPYSISPVDGSLLRLGWLHEAKALGSDVSLEKLAADLRWYARAFGSRDALAVRLGAGTTLGGDASSRSFVVGGFPDGSLFDISGTNSAVLRGYPRDPGKVLAGRHFAAANLEYRFPLGSPQRGWRSLPLFLRHLRGTLFFDAAQAWSDEFRWSNVRKAAGASLGLDTAVGFALPATAELTVAHGFDDTGETKVYFRLGMAF